MEKQKPKIGFALALIGAAALGGCERHEQRAMAEERERVVRQPPARRAVGDELSREAERGDVAGQTPISVATAGAVGGAVQSMAEARCARQAQCNGVSPAASSDQKSVCVTTLRDKVAVDLNVLDCPGGIDQKALDRCLAEIGEDSCNNPIESLGSISSCGSSDICKGP